MKSFRTKISERCINYFFILLFTFSCTTPEVKADPQDISQINEEDSERKKIKLALLLDTSNSMDGLINQAKSQLWTLVNELAKAECNGEKPTLEIALYEYGNDRLSARENYIRMVTPLTNDLDKLSQDLFSLNTNGGSEFCGAVIQQSLNELDWSRDSTDLQIVFIAGNEPFTQGNVPYYTACQHANEKGVVINTIFCGDFEEGVRTQWQHGAQVTGGTYMSIDHNKVSTEIDTPYDDDIVRLNQDLNQTYYWYGSNGDSYRSNQRAQDLNAVSLDKKVAVKRSISKSTSKYKEGAKKWDIVSAAEDNIDVVEEMEEEELNDEMKAMSVEERKDFVKEKQIERAKIEAQIADLSVKREGYLQENMKTEDKGMLQNALINAIHTQAKQKNITIK